MEDDVRDELGPFATGLGGAIAVAGAIMPWAVVSFQPGPLGVIPSKLFTPVRHVVGTHTTDGKIAVAVGLGVALLGIVGLLLRRRRVHLVVGIAAAAGSLVLGAFGIVELGSISDSSAVFDPLRYPLTFRGVPFRHFVSVSSSYGLPVLIAGAALGLAASLFVVFRALRRRPAHLAPAHPRFDS